LCFTRNSYQQKNQKIINLAREQQPKKASHPF
jgi:hypothetical protein